MNDTRDMIHQPFSRRYGYEALPQAMRLESLSEELRIDLWNLSRRLLLGRYYRKLWINELIRQRS